MDDVKNPGEAHTRARRWRLIFFVVLAGIIGAAIGGLLSMAETGEGDFLVGDIENLTIPAWASVGLAVAFLVALAALPLWGLYPDRRLPVTPKPDRLHRRLRGRDRLLSDLGRTRDGRAAAPPYGIRNFRHRIFCDDGDLRHRQTAQISRQKFAIT